MCYYITATLSPDGNESAVRRLAQGALLRWEQLDHPGVIKQLRDGEGYFATTRRMCDCETEIGMCARMERTLPPREPDLSRELKKLRKKGWSGTKIERWFEQAKEDAAKRHDEAAVRLAGPHPEVERWIQFVAAVLTEKRAEWIGFLLHWYSGDVSTEAIAAGNRRWLSLTDFTADYLLNAEEDILHTITL